MEKKEVLIKNLLNNRIRQARVVGEPHVSLIYVIRENEEERYGFNSRGVCFQGYECGMEIPRVAGRLPIGYVLEVQCGWVDCDHTHVEREFFGIPDVEDMKYLKEEFGEIPSREILYFFD